MGKKCKEGQVLPETKQKVHWLKDKEKFLQCVPWSEDKSQSSVNQTFMGNQSLNS